MVQVYVVGISSIEPFPRCRLQSPVEKIVTCHEGIMQSEISQRKANTVQYYLYVESEKAKLIKPESIMGATGCKG